MSSSSESSSSESEDESESSQSPRVIICQYPPLWLVRERAKMCKPHMLELNIDGGWRVDSINIAFKNQYDYKIKHLTYCDVCEHRQEGDATKAKVTNLANCFYLQSMSSKEYDKHPAEEETLVKSQSHKRKEIEEDPKNPIEDKKPIVDLTEVFKNKSPRLETKDNLE
jgi:hypothetical protein